MQYFVSNIFNNISNVHVVYAQLTHHLKIIKVLKIQYMETQNYICASHRSLYVNI